MSERVCLLLRTWADFQTEIVEKWHRKRSEVYQELAQCPEKTPPVENCLFRGQEPPRGECWGLVPSLARCIAPGATAHEAEGEALRLEADAITRFKKVAHLHISQSLLPGLDQDAQFCLMVMQQYGIPTRLLDWTFSPYVAAYFAVRELHEEEGQIWFFDRQEVKKTVQDVHKASDDSVHGSMRTQMFRPSYSPNGERDPDVLPWLGDLHSFLDTPRLHVQQGVHTVSRRVTADHGDVVDELASRAGMPSPLRLARIPCTAKPEFLHHLRYANITGDSLFPDLQGVGMGIADMAKLESRSRRTEGHHGSPASVLG